MEKNEVGCSGCRQTQILINVAVNQQFTLDSQITNAQKYFHRIKKK